MTMVAPMSAADLPLCGDCKRTSDNGQDFFTQINPKGGYGLPQLLVCDECMRSGRWNHWIAEHFPNWPEKRNG